MNSIIEKFANIERTISQRKGPFSLFALFLREDSIDKWDFLVSAPWIEKNKWFAYRYFDEEIKRVLTKKEILSLSRIVIIELKNPMLDAIHRAFKVEHELVEVENSNLFGLQIKHAYIFSSKHFDKKTA